MSNTFISNGSTIGFDPSNISATALFALGSHVLGSNDSEWVYVQAQTTISAVSWCVYNATYSAAMASAADVLVASNTIALSNVNISASSFGWLAIRGTNLSARFTGTGSLAPTSGEFHLAASALQTGLMGLGTIATASCTLAGVGLAATASASASASGGLGVDGSNVCLVNLYWPLVKTT